jgi:hypothetical protein
MIKLSSITRPLLAKAPVSLLQPSCRSSVTISIKNSNLKQIVVFPRQD